MRPRRILFVYQFLTLGGVEVVMQTRLQELARRNIDARALFLESYGGESLFEKIGNQIAVRTDKTDIEKYLKDFDPDWISTIDTPAIIPIARSVVPDAKIAYEAHSAYPASYAVLLDREFCDGVSGIIVPSPSQQDFVSLRIARPLPIKVAANSVPEDFFQQTGFSDSHERPILMWVGRLDPVKNWRGFIEIAMRIRKRADAEFWLVGGLRSSYQEQESLFNAVKQEDLMDSFRWLPSVEYREMPHLYGFVARSGGCLVSTSRAESFGMAALEAMASRCPVFAPDVVGLRDVVKDGTTGWLYPPGNNDRVCDLILQSFENPHIRQNIIENAEQTARKFNPAASVDQLLEAFAEWSGDVPPKSEPLLSERQGLINQMRALAEQGREKAEIQKAEVADRELILASLSRQLSAQQQTIESLSQQSNEQQQVIQSLSQQSNEQQQVIQSLSQQSNEHQQLIESLRTQLMQEQTELYKTTDAMEMLRAQLDQKEVSLQLFSAQLASKETELRKITSSLGWRLLSRYGLIKYRYLLPIYRLLGLGPKKKEPATLEHSSQDPDSGTGSIRLSGKSS